MWANTNQKLAHSIPEVCELTGFGRTFVYSEIRDGHLKARKAGGRTVVLDPDLKGYLTNLPSLKNVASRDDV